MQFDAPWNDTLRMITAGASALMLGAALFATRKRRMWVMALALAAAAAFLTGSWGYAPKGYTVDGGVITIQRPFGGVTIEKADVKSVRPFEEADGVGMIRTGGNGGMFGFYGNFKSDRLGSHKWYVTDKARMVVIETRDGAVVVSPDNPAKFVEAANRKQ